MRLATRFTLLLVSLTIAIAASIGWIAVSQSVAGAKANLTQKLEQIAGTGVGHPIQALSNVLSVVEYNHDDVSLNLVAPGIGVTPLYQGSSPLPVAPSMSDVRASLYRVSAVAHIPGFLLTSIPAGGGDFLVIAASTSLITSDRNQLATKVILTSLAVILLALFLGWIGMRRNLRTIVALSDFARRRGVTDSEGVVEPSMSGGAREVVELRDALVSMVSALEGQIEREARLSRSMQEFVGDASHELRTPLTVIKGYTELLARPGIADEQRERALARMGEQEVRMQQLIEDLLLLTEVSEVSQHTNEQTNVSGVVSAAVGLFEEETQRHVSLELEDGVTIAARRVLVERILTNALTNIQRYTDPADPVHVAVVTNEHEVSLTVEDGGPGLPVYGVAPRRFQRFEESRSRDLGGSGLGMAIMDSIATALGGSMVTQPSPLGGLALTFRFPLA